MLLLFLLGNCLTTTVSRLAIQLGYRPMRQKNKLSRKQEPRKFVVMTLWRIPLVLLLIVPRVKE
uniref:Uncharacterized protein n=1 Tax=Rhizophora mucronata TaxID=61149 RepID=A0A2P2QDE6_RHIMU